MFDDLDREFERLERGFEVRIPLSADEEGYLDKECPSEDCRFQFKIQEQDWKELVRDEEVFCPLCGHTADAESWYTTEQLQHSDEQVLHVVDDMISQALDRSAKRFNQRQPKGGLIQMSLEVKGNRGLHAVVPAPASEPLTLKISCEECGTRYAVVGSAFFCPACGHSSVVRVFEDSLRKIRVKAEHAGTIREQFANQGQRDEGELLARSLLETALADCVVAIQRLAEQLYRGIPGSAHVRMNAFQRLDEGSRLWEQATGEGYHDWINDDELSSLRILFQRRHLLQHSDGIVDQVYIDRSGDTSYQAGQRIVVKAGDVDQLAAVVNKLAGGMRKAASTVTRENSSEQIEE